MLSSKLKSGRQSLIILFLAGCVIILGGVSFLAWLGRGGPYLFSIFVGIGGSVAAAALVGLVSPVTEEMLEGIVARAIGVLEKFRSLGIKEVFAYRNKVPPDQWVKWLGQARGKCVLFGVKHRGWRDDRNFEPTLIDRLEHGVEIAMLFLDPFSEAARLRAEEEREDTTKIIRKSIAIIWGIRKNLKKERPELSGRLKLYVYNATPSSGVTWIDKFMVATHYLAGFPNLTSPALFVEPSKPGEEESNLYEIYADNIRHIRERNSTLELTEENIGKYIEDENTTKAGGDNGDKPK